MAKFSIIDFGKEDFLRDINGSALKLWKKDEIEVEKWLNENGEKFGYTHQGVIYFNWDEWFK